jgi:hypothetical protein
MVEAIHNALKVCLLTPGNEGNPVYLNKWNYNLLEAGGTSDLTGGAGHVMLEIPLFYYSYAYTNSTHSYRVSLTPFDGGQKHPAFFREDVWLNYRYVGIYPAIGFTTTYQNGDGVNAWFNTSTGKLGSVAGYKPISNLSRTNTRAAAARVGLGWSITDFWTYSMLKLLYITKYKNFNSQLLLGEGNSKFASWNYTTCISATGKVKSFGASGQDTTGGNSGDYVKFLGIEDIFGGLWEWIDGWNINNGVNYVCTNPSQFADTITANYTLYGTTNPLLSGYQATLQNNIGFLPASVGGSGTSSARITDYYYYAGGSVAPFAGGSAYYGSLCGLFSLVAYYSASFVGSAVGSRLCF